MVTKGKFVFPCGKIKEDGTTCKAGNYCDHCSFLNTHFGHLTDLLNELKTLDAGFENLCGAALKRRELEGQGDDGFYDALIIGFTMFHETYRTFMANSEALVRANVENADEIAKMVDEQESFQNDAAEKILGILKKAAEARDKKKKPGAAGAVIIDSGELPIN